MLLSGALVVFTISALVTQSAGRCAWRVVVTHSKGDLYNVTVAGKRNVWAVGVIDIGSGHFQPLVLRWNGARWQRIITAHGDNLSSFSAIAFAASDDAWAVGDGVEHWDGRSWTIVPAADLGGGTANLRDVAMLAKDDAWAVGRYSPDNRAAQATIEHWNGKNWKAVAVPDVGQSQLVAVAGVLSTNVWAVGNRRLDTLIEHWDGTRWSVVPNPIQHGYFSDIAAISPDNLWAAGGKQGEPLIEHWDGRGWRVVASPRLAGSLDSITAISKNDIWAAGSRGRDQLDAALVEHWDGRRWGIVPTPKVKDLYGGIQGIDAAGKNDLWWVAGAVGGPERAVSEHFSCLR
jgi:hypothetical protein